MTITTKSATKVSQLTIHIIIHPEGELDIPGLGYWTEVVEMPSCIADGSSENEATQKTIMNIRSFLGFDISNIIVERAL